jgi:hypothetical protein
MRAFARRAQSYPDIFTPPGAPDGFVWEEDGKIVGNISVVKYFQADGRKVLIANVACGAGLSPQRNRQRAYPPRAAFYRAAAAQ